MKRYLAFFGDKRYPNGGMGDYLSNHTELVEAIKAISSADPAKAIKSSWGHVYDTVNKEIVYKK